MTNEENYKKQTSMLWEALSCVDNSHQIETLIDIFGEEKVKDIFVADYKDWKEEEKEEEEPEYEIGFCCKTCLFEGNLMVNETRYNELKALDLYEECEDCFNCQDKSEESSDESEEEEEEEEGDIEIQVVGFGFCRYKTMEDVKRKLTLCKNTLYKIKGDKTAYDMEGKYCETEDESEEEEEEEESEEEEEEEESSPTYRELMLRWKVEEEEKEEEGKFRYEYDDNGVACRYNIDENEWEAIEPHCLNCGYRTGECNCGSYQCATWFDKENAEKNMLKFLKTNVIILF